MRRRCRRRRAHRRLQQAAGPVGGTGRCRGHAISCSNSGGGHRRCRRCDQGAWHRGPPRTRRCFVGSSWRHRVRVPRRHPSSTHWPPHTLTQLLPPPFRLVSISLAGLPPPRAPARPRHSCRSLTAANSLAQPLSLPGTSTAAASSLSLLFLSPSHGPKRPLSPFRSRHFSRCPPSTRHLSLAVRWWL